MSLEERTKATAKNIAGKIQDAAGNLTGNPKTQAEGKAKQADARRLHIEEDIKEDFQERMERDASDRV